MEKIVESLNDPVYVSAAAAALSALCALFTFLFSLLSRRVSRREMVDTLKLEILQVVSTVQGRQGWMEIVQISTALEGDGVGPKIDRLAGLLGVMYQSKRKRKSKYQKDKWLIILPIALEELKKEGYKDLLGM